MIFAVIYFVGMVPAWPICAMALGGYMADENLDHQLDHGEIFASALLGLGCAFFWPGLAVVYLMYRLLRLSYDRAHKEEQP